MLLHTVPQRSAGVYLLSLGLLLLVLAGCESDSDPSQQLSGRAIVNVVFPTQTTSQQEISQSAGTSSHDTVRTIPSDVDRITLTITGPEFTYVHDIDITTGQTQVEVPAGPSLVFEVSAFLSGASVPKWYGRYEASISPEGGTVTVTLAVVSSPTITSPGDQVSAEGAPVSLQIAAAVPDGEALTYSASNLPPGLTLDATTGWLSGTLSRTAATNSPYTVTVMVTDGLTTVQTTFTWTVTNPVPTMTSLAQQTSLEGATIGLQLQATDADSDPLTYSASNLPPGLTLDATTGWLSGTLSRTAATGSPYTVTVTVADGQATVQTTFTWVVTNPVPTMTSLAQQTSLEGATIGLQLQATDTDSDPLTYSASNLPPGLTLDATTGWLSGTLSRTAATGSPYTVTVTIADGQATVQTTFTWVVTNPTPTLTNPGTQMSRNGATISSLQIQATDPDGDSLSFSATGLPPGLTLHVSTGLISGTLSRTAPTGSPYTVGVTVTDGVASSSTVFQWLVSNTAPVAEAGADQTVLVRESVTLDGRASHDPDGDTLSFLWSLVTRPTQSNAALAAPSTPQPTLVADIPGTYVVQLVVNDGTLDSTADHISITVQLPQPGFAYVANEFYDHDGPRPTISVFKIVHHPTDPSTHGALQEIAESPFDVQNIPLAITVHPAGHAVYVVGDSYTDRHGTSLATNISGFARNTSTGTLTALPEAQLSTGYSRGVTVEPAGRFVYVSGFIDPPGEGVSGFQRDTDTEALTMLPEPAVQPGSFLGALAVDPSSRFVYVASSDFETASGAVLGFSINADTGALTTLPGSPFRTGMFSWALAVAPSGRFVYVTDSDFETASGSVFGFSINADTGALTALPGSPFRTGLRPWALAVDPSGHFVYVADTITDSNANTETGVVFGFRIDADTGTLTALPGSPFSIGKNLYALAVDPSGQFVYIGTQGLGLDTYAIARYTIDRATGALTEVLPRLPVGNNTPLAIAIASQ